MPIRRLILIGLLLALVLAPIYAAPQLQPLATQQANDPNDPNDLIPELRMLGWRLPLAAVLGTALALRPRRRGTPERRTYVVQTQIVLAIVGAIVMLIVGASLARAFGIVGVASLIRYRTKIDNPKDAGVMLCALAVGLASGAGFYVLAVFSTVFLVLALGVIESFEPLTRSFELSIKLADKTMGALRPRIEATLRRLRVKFELRGVSEEDVTYFVTAPAEMRTDAASKALTAVLPDDKGAVEWHDASKSKGK